MFMELWFGCAPFLNQAIQFLVNFM